MKKFKEIVLDGSEPKETNVLWVDTNEGTTKIFNNGKWENIQKKISKALEKVTLSIVCDEDEKLISVNGLTDTVYVESISSNQIDGSSLFDSFLPMEVMNKIDLVNSTLTIGDTVYTGICYIEFVKNGNYISLEFGNFNVSATIYLDENLDKVAFDH